MSRILYRNVVCVLLLAVLFHWGCTGNTGTKRSLISPETIDQSLLAANKNLKKKNSECEKKKKELLEKVAYHQGRENAHIILRNELDAAIEDLLKYGGVRKRDRIALEDQFFFEPGSADLTDRGKQYLRKIARDLKKMEYIIRIEGHTDATPVKSSVTKRRYVDNWGLSAARAGSVIRYLQESGIPGERLAGAFYGPYRPVSENTEEGNKLNRRVEIRLIPPYSPDEIKMGISEDTVPGKEEQPVRNYGEGDSFLDRYNQEREPEKEVEEPVKVEEPIKVEPETEDEEPEIIEEDDTEESGAPVIIQ